MAPREQEHDRQLEADALTALAAVRGCEWWQYPELYPVDGGLIVDGRVHAYVEVKGASWTTGNARYGVVQLHKLAELLSWCRELELTGLPEVHRVIAWAHPDAVLYTSAAHALREGKLVPSWARPDRPETPRHPHVFVPVDQLRRAEYVGGR